MKTSKSVPGSRPLVPAKKATRPQNPLVSSPAQAKLESARLRRGRERLEATPTAAETDIRASLI